AKIQETQNTLFPWDEGTNKTEDEKLTAWMVSDNGFDNSTPKGKRLFHHHDHHNHHHPL
ncbi:hypothetical protein DOY81_011635, partial [Sarcophaga bullata]